jgi:flagellar biosynthetic protein FliR/FlhB
MINVAYVSALFLVFLRVVTFFAAVQVLFPNGLPNTVKILFSLTIAYFIVSSINYSNVTGIDNGLIYAQQCAFEVLTGLVLGYLTNLVFMCGQIAGGFIDVQIGFSMVTLFDPTTQTNTTLIGSLMQMFSIVLFFIIDGHLVLVKALIDSFSVIHIGSFVLGNGSAMYALNAFIQFFEIAVRIAIPVVIILIITDIVLGLVSRTVPQLNVMILGLPIKVLLGMFVFMLSLPIMINVMIHAYSLIPDLWKGFYTTIPGIIIFADGDKTESATPKKKSEARKKGQTAKSKEVPLAITLLTSSIIFITLGNSAYNQIKNMMITFFNGYMSNPKDFNFYTFEKIMFFSVENIGIVFLMFAVPIMIMGIGANFLQSGFMLTTEPLKPDLKKLNPISGIKKMFSIRTFVDLLKDLALVSVVGYVGYRFVIDNFDSFLGINTLNFDVIPGVIKGLFLTILLKITLIMVVIAVADYIYQRYMFNRDLKMTKQEVKEEFKQQEGDPHIKGKRRQKMREMSMRRMMSSVPDATVVVTNPTHIAVALKYTEGSNSAPVVVAKGADRIALKIKEIAKENEVTIIENKPLARLMYSEVEIDEEIPMSMYQAVAEILAIVLKLKSKG